MMLVCNIPMDPAVASELGLGYDDLGVSLAVPSQAAWIHGKMGRIAG